MTTTELFATVIAALLSLVVRELSNRRLRALSDELEETRAELIQAERDRHKARLQLARHGIAEVEALSDDKETEADRND